MILFKAGKSHINMALTAAETPGLTARNGHRRAGTLQASEGKHHDRIIRSATSDRHDTERDEAAEKDGFGAVHVGDAASLRKIEQEQGSQPKSRGCKKHEAHQK